MTDPMNRDEAVLVKLVEEMRQWAVEGCYNDAEDGEAPFLMVHQTQQSYLAIADRIEAALTALRSGGGGDAQPPSDEVWPPDGAVWLAPVATDAPANPKLMQYAWGRSSLSSGQMAEAYQCIVSAAQECGQVYRLPVALPHPQPARGEAVACPRIKPLVWEDHGDESMCAKGFHIQHDPEDCDHPNQPWCLVWGEGEPEYFASRDDAKADAYRQWAEFLDGEVAPPAAQPAEAGKVRGLVEKWLVEVEKYAGTHAYVEGMRKCADELEAALAEQARGTQE